MSISEDDGDYDEVFNLQLEQATSNSLQTVERDVEQQEELLQENISTC